eukprot:m.162681 g.162681  ORF g.162681 m.162681 type:complete len:331 (+) comp18077_c0_seq1:232-1224(+)
MSHYKGDASEGGRAEKLMKAREKERELMRAKKDALEEDMKRSTAKIHNKFSVTAGETIEQSLRQSTYGLVTLADMKAKQQALEDARDSRIKRKLEGPGRWDNDMGNKKKKNKKKAKAVLSFDEEVDIPEEELEKKTDAAAVKNFKNPDVDTSFLPDRERDQKEREERERLRKSWLERQQKLKDEAVEITYSYWDGSGHRRSIKLKKGNSIEEFLTACLADLRSEFHELRGVSAEGLIYVKEDLLIPQHYTFYDFIVTKARGKSGPLFSFDVHDDVRLVNDATVEKDESHAGKVVLRSWYERNKHIFPASRWETYDPEKKWDKYTIADFNA